MLYFCTVKTGYAEVPRDYEGMGAIYTILSSLVAVTP